jgi:hypothetical protein
VIKLTYLVLVAATAAPAGDVGVTLSEERAAICAEAGGCAIVTGAEFNKIASEIAAQAYKKGLLSCRNAI